MLLEAGKVWKRLEAILLLVRDFKGYDGKWKPGKIQMRLPNFVRSNEIAPIGKDELYALPQQFDDAKHHLSSLRGRVSQLRRPELEVFYRVCAVVEGLNVVVLHATPFEL